MSGSCVLTNNMDNVSLYDKMMYGGMGYGTFCVPKELPNYIMVIIFPPLSVFVQQWNNGFKRIDKIIICFVLTAFFYFPGLLYGLNELSCGGITGGGGSSKCVNRDPPQPPDLSSISELPVNAPKVK
jgi:uncharacterized membrane protein YqaE (UPF0057 family)